MPKRKKYEALFKPIKINKLEIKNRIVMAPMCTFLNTHDGYVNDPTLAYFAARAKGVADRTGRVAGLSGPTSSAPCRRGRRGSAPRSTPSPPSP